MKKLTLAKHISFITFAALFFIFTMVMWILSFQNKMADSSKIKFSETYALYMIMGVCFLVATIYSFVVELKGLKKNALVTYGAYGAASLMFSMFFLSEFFNALLGYWDKEYFAYKDQQWNLYLGLIALALTVGIVIKYLDEEKK